MIACAYHSLDFVSSLYYIYSAVTPYAAVIPSSYLILTIDLLYCRVKLIVGGFLFDFSLIFSFAPLWYLRALCRQAQ